MQGCSLCQGTSVILCVHVLLHVQCKVHADLINGYLISRAVPRYTKRDINDGEQPCCLQAALRAS